MRKHEEQPEYLRCAIDRIGAASVGSLILLELSREFSRLPVRLGAAFAGLFAGSPIPRTTAELFVRAGLPERTGIRWIRRVGLRGAKDLLRCARLALTWEEVRNPRSNLADIASRAGIGTERALYNTYRDYCGLSPRRAGQELRTSDFADRTVSAIRNRLLLRECP